jgi:hypothetical protein
MEVMKFLPFMYCSAIMSGASLMIDDIPKVLNANSMGASKSSDNVTALPLNFVRSRVWRFEGTIKGGTIGDHRKHLFNV